MNETADSARRADAETGLYNYTQLIYALHACAVLMGIFTGATIAGRFLFGLPSIIAVVLNYARRSEVRGTWLESHFAWQIRTFWFSLLWVTVTLLIGAPLTLVLIGVYLVMLGFALVGLWVAYRVARGWLRLRDRQAMPIPLPPPPAAPAPGGS